MLIVLAQCRHLYNYTRNLIYQLLKNWIFFAIIIELINSLAPLMLYFIEKQLYMAMKVPNEMSDRFTNRAFDNFSAPANPILSHGKSISY